MKRWALGLLAVLLAIVNSGCSGIVSGSNSPAPSAPSISTQPTSQTVTSGQTATFSVAAMGTAPFTYQWKKNSVAISGATSSAYTTPATTSYDNGAQFTVVVSNAAGSATSSAAMLTVSAAAVAPSITMQPASQTITAGQTASFSVAATGTAPLTYQWRKNSAAVSGANSSSYTTSATASSDNGAQFTVVVSNASGSATSNAATLTVNAPATLQITTAQLPGGFVAGAYTSTLTASGGSTPYTWSLLSGTLPSGLTLNAGGSISGTPSLAGSFPFTVQVKDAAGLSASANFSINVASPVPTVAISSPANGATVSSPKPFTGAAAVTQPGSVVCLLAGTYNLSSTFYPPTSGSPSSWIVYKSYGNGAVNLVWTAGAIAQPMFKFGGGSFPSGPAYLEFRGLNLDGQNNALDGFFCQGDHHLRFIGNSINNTGGSGVRAIHCDYLTSDHNLINHNGYLYGWTSAISYNNDQWFDNYSGFHNIISNNIITGDFDGTSNHTDGNRIILDLGGNTPPALIINNVAYG